MSNLSTYLNDHLAGATAALELLDHLIERADGDEFARLCQRLRAEIQADVDELRGMQERLDVEQSGVKKAAAWLAGKVTDAKFLFSGEQPGGLGRLQALEALCLGILGKRALWLALQAVQPAGVADLDFERLIRRAEEQFSWSETERLKTAREALSH